MGNLFFGLNVGRSALIANQAALDVAGHNLANVQTEGYSRQKATLVPSQSIQFAQSTFGSGVTLEGVERIQVSWLERQINRVRAQNGYADVLQKGVDQLQSLLGEPSEDGVSGALTDFWNQWEALSVQPADAALRDQVVEQANHLADAYNQKVDALLEAEKGFNEALADDLDQVNALTERLADLNGEIAKFQAGGRGAGDLEDQRDLLVSQVADKLGVEVEADGSYVNLRIQGGGPYIVSGTESFEITAETSQEGMISDFQVGPGPARLSGGEIGALLELQNEISPGLRQDLADWMGTVADRVNQLHGAGFDRNGEAGRNLLVWEGNPSRIAISPETGIASVESLTDIQPGTHHLEASLASSAGGDPGITLAYSGSFSGSLVGPDYQVRVVSGSADPNGLQVALFRGGTQVGDPVSPASDGAGHVGYSWADVDGLTLSTVITSPLAQGQQSNTLAVQLSLDGGPPQFVDASGANVAYTFVGGEARGFASGGTATVSFSNRNFSDATFTTYSADGRLGVDTLVATDPDRIAAAAAPGSSGDGEMARRISALAGEAIFPERDETAASFLARTVQSLGMKGRDAEILGDSGRSILNQLQTQKAGEVGVNMDEEMVLLIQHQRGFQAAARFLNTVDGLLDTLINGVGR